MRRRNDSTSDRGISNSAWPEGLDSDRQTIRPPDWAAGHTCTSPSPAGRRTPSLSSWRANVHSTTSSAPVRNPMLTA